MTLCSRRKMLRVHCITDKHHAAFLSASASPAGKWLVHKQKPNSEPWVAVSISVHTHKVIYLLVCLCNLIFKGSGCLNIISVLEKNISLLIGSHICFWKIGVYEGHHALLY